MSTHQHTAACTWQPEPRCTRNGHRIYRIEGNAMLPPRETREFLRHPRTWLLIPFEVTGRAEALIRRWAHA